MSVKVNISMGFSMISYLKINSHIFTFPMGFLFSKKKMVSSFTGLCSSKSTVDSITTEKNKQQNSKKIRRTHPELDLSTT